MLILYTHIMMRLRRTWSLLLILGMFAPDMAFSWKYWQNEDPCGMVVCCCPERCLKLKKAGLRCRMSGVSSCGIKTTQSTESRVIPAIPTPAPAALWHPFEEPPFLATPLFFSASRGLSPGFASPLERPPANTF